MKKKIPIELNELNDLIKKYGSPLQLYDKDGIAKTATTLNDTFKKYFPTFKEYYAVKALPNPSVLKLITDLDCGLDCSSTSELFIAKKLNVLGENVMFTSNYTSKKDLEIAYDNNVVINLDDISLIDSIIEIKGKCPELISFRLNPGVGRTDSETKSNVLGGPDAKFGVPPYQIIDAYKKAKANGSTRFGIHMMTGSCVTNTEYWNDTVSILIETLQKLKSELDIKEFEFINIGGGLGIPYRETEDIVDIDRVAQIVRKSFDLAIEKGIWTKDKEPKLYMENGRYLTGPHGYLISTCEAIKNTYAKYYGLDSCMANLMRPGYNFLIYIFFLINIIYI